MSYLFDFVVVVEKRLNENTVSLTTKGNPQLCQLCEQFATETLFYLKENETRVEIIDTLHQACLKFHSLKLEVFFLLKSKIKCYLS